VRSERFSPSSARYCCQPLPVGAISPPADGRSGTVGTGMVLAEAAATTSTARTYPASRPDRNLWRVGTFGIDFGVGSIAEIQIKGGVQDELSVTNRAPAPLSSLYTFRGHVDARLSRPDRWRQDPARGRDGHAQRSRSSSRRVLPIESPASGLGWTPPISTSTSSRRRRFSRCGSWGMSASASWDRRQCGRPGRGLELPAFRSPAPSSRASRSSVNGTVGGIAPRAGRWRRESVEMRAGIALHPRSGAVDGALLNWRHGPRPDLGRVVRTDVGVQRVQYRPIAKRIRP